MRHSMKILNLILCGALVFPSLGMSAEKDAQKVKKIQARAMCANLGSEVEEGVKILSFVSARPTRGDSPPKDLERLRALALIQANLTLMVSHKCEMPMSPISDSAYKRSAEKCVESLRKQNVFTGTSDSPECLQKNWVRDKS